MESKSMILVTDIFGLCEPLLKIVNDLSEDDCKVTILDPYQGQIQYFNDEHDAYDAFCRNCGHDQYANAVSDLLDIHQPQVIVGFSAGATATWRALCSLSSNTIAHFIGFYPGQIRHHLELNATCPSTFIFPSFETHFEVNPVIDTLRQQANVSVIKTDLLHGFMNSNSKHFSKQASTDCWRALFDSAVNHNPAHFQQYATELFHITKDKL